MDGKRERKKGFRWSKAKAKKYMRGSISILLCLVITPILSVTLGLIEYARYQQVMEVADELIELTGLTGIADYDPYIHDRFGMLAVSQDGTLGDGLETVLQENAKITGDQLVPGALVTKGKFSLLENSVLRRQILDFSQLTTPTAFVMKNLQLEEILEKLKSLEGFSKVTDTVDKLATATEQVTAAVNALGTLKTDMQTLQDSITTAKANATSLADKFTNLIKQLGDGGITLPASASAEDIRAAVQAFVDDGSDSGSLLDQIKDIYTGAKELKDNFDSIKTAAVSVKSSAGAFRTAVQNAADAISSIGSSESEQSKGISQAMTTTVDSVVKEMEKVATETLTQLKDDVIQTIKDTADRIVDTILEETGLSGVISRYTSIANGTYFRIDGTTLTVSDSAKEDITEFLKMAHSVYNNHGASTELIKGYFVGRFVPNLTFDPSVMIDKIDQALTEAEGKLGDKMDTGLSNLIEKLGNLLNKIVSFSVFSEPNLNSVVSLENGDKNGAQDFVDAMNDLSDAIDSFKDSIRSFNLIGALTAIAKLLKAIWEMFKAIMAIIGDMLVGIHGLGAGWGAIYDRLIVSGYMVHSLPSRTDYAREMSGGIPVLKGESLSGYSFKDIPRGDNTFDGAELEYIYKGTNDETVNQTLTFWDIYFLRLLLDLPSVFMDEEVGFLATAATIAAWVVYIIYVLAEPFFDTLLLVNGGEAPLIKTKCWLTVQGMVVFAPALANVITGCDDLKAATTDFFDGVKGKMGGNSSSGGVGEINMKYEDYLLFMLTIFVDTDSQVQRLGNLIGLESAQYYQEKGKTFDLAKTYTALELTADMTFNPFVDLGILAGNGPLNVSGKMTHMVSY